MFDSIFANSIADGKHPVKAFYRSESGRTYATAGTLVVLGGYRQLRTNPRYCGMQLIGWCF